MTNRLLQLREQNNLTQTELAEKSGISLRTIQRIEAGHTPKGYTLKTLAETLSVSTKDLIIPDQEKLDVNRVKMINISCLSFFVLPFGNIIVPAILISRSKNEKAVALGNSILMLQIIWTILTSLLMIVSPFLQLTLTRLPVFIVILLVMMLLNTVIIFKNAQSLSSNGALSIKLKKSLL